MVKRLVEGGCVKVESPYNKKWVTRARELGGKWREPYWVFSMENWDIVSETLMDIYGEDGTSTPDRITVDIQLDKEEWYGRELTVGGITVARRWARDDRVSMCNEAVLVSGGFSSSGGSRANPVIGEPSANTVIRVKIPKTKLDEITNDYKVTVHEAMNSCEEPSIDQIIAERDKLAKRIAEIDEILSRVKKEG